MLSKKLWLWLLLLLHLFVFWKIDLLQLLLGRVTLWDFDVYYQTAADVVQGAHPYKLPYMQTAGPPLVIAPYLLFTFIPLPLARSIMTCISLGAIWGSSWRLAKTIFPKDPAIFASTLNFAFLCLFQPRFNLLLGQPNLIIMFLLTVVVTTKLTAKSASFLSFIIILKTHYVLAAIALIRKNLRLLSSVASIGIVLLLCTLPVLKFNYYQDYVASRLSQHAAAPLVINDVGYYNQSLRATVARLSIGATFLVLTILVLLIGGGYIYVSQDLAAGFLLSLLISPIVWQHYMVITYPIIFLTFIQYFRYKKTSWTLLVAAVLLLAHIPWLHEKPVSLPLGIAASHYFWGVCLLFLSRWQLYRQCGAQAVTTSPAQALHPT